MIRPFSTLALIALGPLAGCLLQAETDTGPTVSITLSADNGTASDTDDTPELDFEGASELSVALEIDTESGTSSVDDTLSAVTQFTGTLSIPPTSFSEADFTSDGNSDAPTFTSNDTVTIPASAVGQMLAVVLGAEDAAGLRSNAISFRVMLVDSSAAR